MAPLLSIADYLGPWSARDAQMMNARFGEMARGRRPVSGASWGISLSGGAHRPRRVGTLKTVACPQGSLLWPRTCLAFAFGFGDAELIGSALVAVPVRRLFNERNTADRALAAVAATPLPEPESVPARASSLWLASFSRPSPVGVSTTPRVLATGPGGGVVAPQKAGRRRSPDALSSAWRQSWRRRPGLRDEASGHSLGRARQRGNDSSSPWRSGDVVTVLTLRTGRGVPKPPRVSASHHHLTSHCQGRVSLSPEDQYLNASLSTSLVSLAGGAFPPPGAEQDPGRPIGAATPTWVLSPRVNGSHPE